MAPSKSAALGPHLPRLGAPTGQTHMHQPPSTVSVLVPLIFLPVLSVIIFEQKLVWAQHVGGYWWFDGQGPAHPPTTRGSIGRTRTQPPSPSFITFSLPQYQYNHALLQILTAMQKTITHSFNVANSSQIFLNPFETVSSIRSRRRLAGHSREVSPSAPPSPKYHPPSP